MGSVEWIPFARWKPIFHQDRKQAAAYVYSDGNYYSDCSSSICYIYKEVGENFGILSTAGIYLSDKLITVEVSITAGVPKVSCLSVGDMLEFVGNAASRRMAQRADVCEGTYRMTLSPSRNPKNQAKKGNRWAEILSWGYLGISGCGSETPGIKIGELTKE